MDFSELSTVSWLLEFSVGKRSLAIHRDNAHMGAIENRPDDRPDLT